MVEGIERFCPTVDLVLGRLANVYGVPYKSEQGGLNRDLSWRDGRWEVGVSLDLKFNQRRFGFLEILVSVGSSYRDVILTAPTLAFQKRQLKTPVPEAVLERAILNMAYWTALEAGQRLTHQ